MQILLEQMLTACILSSIFSPLLTRRLLTKLRLVALTPFRVLLVVYGLIGVEELTLRALSQTWSRF